MTRMLVALEQFSTPHQNNMSAAGILRRNYNDTFNSRNVAACLNPRQNSAYRPILENQLSVFSNVRDVLPTILPALQPSFRGDSVGVFTFASSPKAVPQRHKRSNGNRGSNGIDSSSINSGSSQSILSGTSYPLKPRRNENKRKRWNSRGSSDKLSDSQDSGQSGHKENGLPELVDVGIVRRNKNSRNQSGAPLYNNMMHDSRIIRGNTYAKTTKPNMEQKRQVDAEEQRKKAEIRRRALARRRARLAGRVNGRSTPPPVTGRHNTESQTETYLEELSEKVPETDVSVQTDNLYSRPSTPLFIPNKANVDAETQVYDGDLFEFDQDVVPILEVLVGKTIEQSLLEVLQEEEKDRQAAEQHFQKHQVSEPSEANETEQLVSDTEPEMIPSMFSKVSNITYLFEQADSERIRQEFLPWLIEEVRRNVDKIREGRQTLNDMIAEKAAEQSSSNSSSDITIHELDDASEGSEQPES